MPGGTRGKDLNLWLRRYSSEIRARLVHRYAVDFSDPGPVPEVIRGWLVTLVDREVWKATGTNPEGRVDGWYDEDKKHVDEQLKEAASAQEGLFGLPLKSTSPDGTTAITNACLGYSEQSPYTWTDLQADSVYGH